MIKRKRRKTGEKKRIIENSRERKKVLEREGEVTAAPAKPSSQNLNRTKRRTSKAIKERRKSVGKFLNNCF